MMFKPGYNISSLPSESCSNTTTPLYTIQANNTDGWLALNLVNAGSVAKLAVSLDSHSMYVYAADGLYVTLQEVKVSTDVIMRLTYRPTLTIHKGSLHITRTTLFGDDTP